MAFARKRRMPFLPDNDPGSCPVPRARITAYLRAESASDDPLSDDDIAFVRTARVEDCRYWLWRFPRGRNGAYALVLVDEEGEWLSWRPGRAGKSAEQVLLEDWKSGH